MAFGRYCSPKKRVLGSALKLSAKSKCEFSELENLALAIEGLLYGWDF